MFSVNGLINSRVCFNNVLTAILEKHVYSHFVQLFVDFLIILIVFTELGDQRPIRQSKQLSVLRQKAEILLFTLKCM